jgi:VCBS repeat-containing protein
MKSNFFLQCRRVFGPADRWLSVAKIAIAAGLLAPACLTAAPRVITITGGPTSGYVDGDTAALALFHTPLGLALDSTGNLLYVADRDNNAVRTLNLAGNLTYTFATYAIRQPVGVALDATDHVYVLNRGTGSDGTVLKFDKFGDLLATNATGLVNANGMALDPLGNLYVTVQSNAVVQISPNGAQNVIATIAGANTLLRGIAVLSSGYLAVCDSGRNGVWLINPSTGTATSLTGFNGAGDHFGPKSYAQFNQPFGIAEAGGGMLVVSDLGNNRVKVVDSSGTVTNLYGVNSSYWVTGDGTYPGLWDGEVCAGDLNYNSVGCVEARLPAGVFVARDGSIFTTEIYYHVIRHVTSTGLTAPSAAGLPPLFLNPMGIALDSTGSQLLVADHDNNAIDILDLGDNQTSVFLTAVDGIDQPVAVVLDGFNDLFVLNQGTLNTGSILEFDAYGNLLASVAGGLASPTALTLDTSGNLFVTELAGTVRQINSSTNFIFATVTNSGVELRGIALFDDGTIAVSDAGNHVIWQINPVTKAISRLTGTIGVPGTSLGTARFARMNQPQQLARAAGNLIVAADGGNDRLVVVDRSGSITNVLNSTNALVWFGRAGDPIANSSAQFVRMASPVGVALGLNGNVFASENTYNSLRQLLNTGMLQPSQGGGGNTSSNVFVSVPTLSPNSGYYPMGQLITVSSPNPGVFYTLDGSEPTTNSIPVTINGNVGFIYWSNPTNDLTSLRVKAFIGTNASATAVGQPVTNNTIGVPPAPTSGGQIYAGIGSTIVVPVIVNLKANVQVKSYQFRAEITPNGGGQAIPAGFQTLVVSGNEFVPLKTAGAGNTTLNLPGQAYTIGSTKGLAISTANNGSYSFNSFAVVALLQIPIPPNANTGDSYSLVISYPSATSDGINSSVPLAAMAVATVLVTNVPYTVGDSSSASSSWYNAGGFGNGDLDNADVNNAFYAAAGLRVPYVFSDLFNAMDSYPPDANGFVGGDGQIRFLDWQLILRRSLRLDTNNYARVWASGGYLDSSTTVLQARAMATPMAIPSTWYRQALVGAVSVGNAVPGNTVNVPVYVKMSYGSTLSGLQFRAQITPQNGAPALTQAPQMVLATGVPGPSLQQSYVTSEKAFGWPLGSLSFGSSSSNFLGWISFTVPATALTGQSYSLSFTNADGAPDLNTQYDFETRQANVAVNGPATAARICSTEWLVYYFGSVTDPRAADMADPDSDGIPNWMEFLTGTDPTDPNSKLEFSSSQRQVVNGRPQMTVQFQTAPGRAYELQWSPNLVGGPWTTLTTVTGTGFAASCLDTNAAGPARYYRLHLLP